MVNITHVRQSLPYTLPWVAAITAGTTFSLGAKALNLLPESAGYQKAALQVAIYAVASAAAYYATKKLVSTTKTPAVGMADVAQKANGHANGHATVNNTVKEDLKENIRPQSPVNSREASTPAEAPKENGHANGHATVNDIVSDEREYNLRLRSPVKYREIRTPVKNRGTHTPIKGREVRTPAYHRGTHTPAYDRVTRTPAYHPGTNTPAD